MSKAWPPAEVGSVTSVLRKFDGWVAPVSSDLIRFLPTSMEFYWIRT